MNFATDLPPLISDLERVSELPETDQLDELQQNLRHQQEVLLKVKDYLVYLYDQRDKDNSGELISMGNDAGAIAAAVIQELQLKKTEWVAPISQELDQLTAQKQILEREIYRLNQQYEAALGAFPQQLLSQFQGLLQTQLGKAVALFEQRLRYISSVTHPIQGLEDAGFAASEAQTDTGRSPTEHLQAVQNNLDKSVANLDSTIHTVFTALEQDIAAYGTTLTGNLRQLNGLQVTTDSMTAEAEDVVETPAGEPPVLEEPDSPAVDSLMAIVPDGLNELTDPQEPPATESLFADDDGFNYQEDNSAGNRPSGTGMSPAVGDSTSEEDSVKDDYLDFAASVAEEGLFGEAHGDAETTNDHTLEPEAMAAESFLFGDPVETPDTEETAEDMANLKAVIASPSPTVVDGSDGQTEPTTVKTIQLLTDLLEDGSLNVQDSDTAEDEAESDVEAELEQRTSEDLNPDLETDDTAVTPVDVTVLDPEKMNLLAEDLMQFETTTSDPASEEPIDVEAATDDDNPWADTDQKQEST
ncbi:hypothetical protein [[Limnothrix rosea] IAM M-220]|uniref:hypothetical protein n=1 Tax=[Limnothrix rosea] IAM M-220 TaxID=454133 RepID=UPI001115AACE|nr:hypothetical protein [[Limnothrix rosea] IAM M-220]